MSGQEDVWGAVREVVDSGVEMPREWWLEVFEDGPGKLQGEPTPRVTAYLYIADPDEILSVSDDPFGYWAMFRGVPWDESGIWLIHESDVGFLDATTVSEGTLEVFRKQIEDATPLCDECGEALMDGTCLGCQDA